MLVYVFFTRRRTIYSDRAMCLTRCEGCVLQEALAREAQRRQEAKESARLRKEYEAEQAKKEVLAAKREREEDRAHRAKIQAQIEADKARRRQKALGGDAAAPAAPPPATVAAVAPPPVSQETYTECVLQIRRIDGSSTTATFLPTDTVQSVYEHAGIDRRSFVLMTTFPRKFYSTDADLRMTLLAADLVPRGVMIVTKR